jgi:leucyl aminopeptidase
MKFLATTVDGLSSAHACLVIGVYENNQLTDEAQYLETHSQGYLRKILQLGDFKGKLEQTLLLHYLPNVATPRILLVGLGNSKEISEENYQKIIISICKQLQTIQSNEAILSCHNLPVKKRDVAWKIRFAMQIIAANFYRFDELKSKPAEKIALHQISFHVTKDQEDLANQTIFQGNAIISGIQLTRDLGNLPANFCTPTYLGEQARLLAKEYSELKVTILEEKNLKKLGLNALLAVSQGSAQPPKLITLEYQNGNKKDQPIVLVGKGITFDTGGIWLKPHEGMEDMKFDMCGAATVLGTIKALCMMKLPINVIGVIASAENMPSGTAVKPGDVVTTLSGLTVEIINPDAEGRLILCDALTYCEQFNPKIVIDIATLTGAIMVALGPYASGLFSNNDQLKQDLITAANDSQDHVWPMPIIDAYQNRLDSRIADVRNVSSERGAGSIMAACYLARFCEKFAWAHLDIAATAYINDTEKGATGRPVSLLVQYLLNQIDTL